ncbi:MAG: hypothetical protein NC906_05215 [Candidatus Omnitrophica bacterium]|nr:hypothetical protein [Candidatus Omnitrophota bacterium]MCM8817068.1 hypothetical protein [Candidatus Omnitrophota bacterium]
MIKIEITLAITCYLFLSLLILFLWVYKETKKKTGFLVRKENFLWECPLCFHIYIDSSGSEISKCPLCGSLHKREETGYNVSENISSNREG